METQGFDLMVKTLQGAPLPALLGIVVWFLIYKFWPWYQIKEEGRIKSDLEYRDSWLKQAAAHTREIHEFREEMKAEMTGIRYDLDAVLMLLAKDRPELIEFFERRNDARRKAGGQ